MSDRGILFLFGILMVLVGLGASVWLVVSGQAATVDGLFLLLTCLLAAAAFLLYVVYVIHRAMEPPKPAAPVKAPAAAKTPVVAAQ